MHASVEFFTGVVIGALAYFMYLKWCESKSGM